MRRYCGVVLALLFPVCAWASPKVPRDGAYWSYHLAQAAARPRLKPLGATGYVMPRYDPRCSLKGVLALMSLELRPNVAIPPVFFESSTPLTQFQDAVEPQWGVRPDRFLNVYAAARNEIYILNEAEYYERLGRFVDDSLAHELVHFIQVKYRGIPIEEFDDSLEHEAIAVQTQFRESFMSSGAPPCSGN